MDFKKLILAAIAAFAVMFVFDYLWFMVLPKAVNLFHTIPHEGDSIPMHAFGVFCFALLMAIIYPIGFKGGSAVTEGGKFGVLMGLVANLPTALHQHAGHMASLHNVAGFMINGIIAGALGGILIAMVYGGKKA